MPLILIPLGLLVLISACRPKGEEEDQCIDPLAYLPPKPDQGEKLYSDGDNYVLLDERLGEETAQFYLDIFPQEMQRVLDFFGIDSPWKRNMRLRLIGARSDNYNCPRSGDCGGAGGVTLLHTGDEARLIKQKAIEEGTIYGEEVFIHEMSHALRTGIARPWTGLEEGLAKYTEISLVERATTYDPQGEARKIYDGSLLVSETVQLPPDSDISRITLSAFDESLAEFSSFRERPRHGESAEQAIEIPLNQNIRYGDYIFRVERDENSGSALKVKIYLRATSGGSYTDVLESDIDCDMAGSYSTARIITEDGPITISEGLREYTKPENFDFNRFHEDHGDYTTEFCFWDLIRKEHGHSAVQAIVQSMVELSREHENVCKSYARFPFFETFMAITGMDEASARAYFDIFSAPTDDEWYPLGGVAWAD